MSFAINAFTATRNWCAQITTPQGRLTMGLQVLAGGGSLFASGIIANRDVPIPWGINTTAAKAVAAGMILIPSGVALLFTGLLGYPFNVAVNPLPPVPAPPVAALATRLLAPRNTTSRA